MGSTAPLRAQSARPCDKPYSTWNRFTAGQSQQACQGDMFPWHMSHVAEESPHASAQIDRNHPFAAADQRGVHGAAKAVLIGAIIGVQSMPL